MSIKMDLTKFKHVKSDDKSTTLQHKDGHQLVLAHKALSKEAQGQLQALSKMSSQAQTPLQKDESKHQNAEKMANGGMMDDNRTEDLEASRLDNGFGKVIRRAEGGDVKQGSIKAMTTPEGVQHSQSMGKSDYGRVINLPNDTSKQRADIPRFGGNGGPEGDKAEKFAEGGKVCEHCGGKVHLDEGGTVPKALAPTPEVAPDTENQAPANIPGLTDYTPHAMSSGELDKAKYDRNQAMYDQAAAKAQAEGYSQKPEMVDELATQSVKEQNAQEEAQKQQQILSNQAMQAKQQQTQADKAQLFGTAAPAGQPGALQSGPANPMATDEDQAAQAAAPSAPAQAPARSQGSSVNYPKTPDDFYRMHDTEDKAWQNDLRDGHITPETYSSLFAKKDTLGKVGTLFGMLMSGIGSGLSGQENAVLKGMDSVIKNDLAAQVQSKTNAQNFLKLQQQHDMNNAQIGHLATQDKMTSFELSQMKMYRVALQDQWSKIQKMPEANPQQQQAKQQAIQAFGMVSSGVDAKFQDATSAIASRQALLQNTMAPAQGGNSEQAFSQKMQQYRMSGYKDMADDMEKHHLPGFSQRTSKPVESTHADANAAYQNVFQQLDEATNFKRKNPGAAFSPQLRAQAETLMGNLANQIRTAGDMGVFKKSEAENIASMIGKNPAGFLASIDTDPKLKEFMKLQKQEYGNFLSKLGISPQGSAPARSVGSSFKPAK